MRGVLTLNLGNIILILQIYYIFQMGIIKMDPIYYSSFSEPLLMDNIGTIDWPLSS